jgi:putative DNA methylase
MTPGEIITRRNLPHWYMPGAMHFVTYRLAETIPAEVLFRLREQKRRRLEQRLPEGQSIGPHRERIHKHFFAAYDRYLDITCRIDWLARPAVTALIRSNLHHHNRGKYHLLAYCVMPNHVHVLLQPLNQEPAARTKASSADREGDEQADMVSPLAAIMHSLKSYTAHKANELLGRSGQFWQHESYDHWVRDEEELQRIVDYIAWNPVKASRVKEPHEWFFSSAHDRFLQDGSRLGFLS